MDLTLAIVACGPQLEIALRGGPCRATSLVRLAGVSPRSTLLLGAVDLLFEDAGARPEALARVLVSRGPGSFTGIRAGLATAAGLASALGVEAHGYDSLSMAAGRVSDEVGAVWAAQPGRRGEVYAQHFEVSDCGPKATGGIEVLALADAGDRGPWASAEALEMGDVERAPCSRSLAESLLDLARAGLEPQPFEPLYVEDPPISTRRRR